MHQTNFIEWILNSRFFDDTLAPAYNTMFVNIPWEIDAFDAMGCVLMGGEL